MVNITAGFILAAYLIYTVVRGDLGRLLWIVGLAPETPPAGGAK